MKHTLDLENPHIDAVEENAVNFYGRGWYFLGKIDGIMLFSIISILTSDFHLGHRVLRLIVFNGGEVSKWRQMDHPKMEEKKEERMKKMTFDEENY